MTQEEYKARRKELQEEIFQCRQNERQQIQEIEDKKIAVHRNTADRIKDYIAKAEHIKLDTLRQLNKQKDEIRRKHSTRRAELDSEIKLLDAQLKHDYYVNLKEKGKSATADENDNPNF